MKAGTTSLCRDLAAHPKIYFPPIKEPHTLYLEDVITPSGRRKYADLFKAASSYQICGEGSTGYTKLPYGEKIPFRARRVCGSGLKLIYIVRNPIERALSHHYHAYRAGRVSADFSVALEQDKTIRTCSQYAYQLKPWIDLFGIGQVYVVRFEDYIVDRKRILDDLCCFLGLDPMSDMEQDVAMNVGEQQLKAPEWLGSSLLFDVWSRFKRGQFYKRSVRPLLNEKWIQSMKRFLYTSPPPPRPPTPSWSVLDSFVKELYEDHERFQVLLGIDKPMWDMQKSWRER